MKAIRLHIKQNSANYRKEETIDCRMTYPLPPYSTVIGAIHKACGYTSYHPMQLSVQGKYGSLQKKVFREDCFLNRTEDDRNILVKMSNSDMLSSAYKIVAAAQKAQGNSFEKGITINVVNQKLLDEYRFLKRTKRRIDRNRKVIARMKDKLKKMKADENISAENIKAFNLRIKQREAAHKEYERVKYSEPFAKFRTLAKGPKYYEILCDIELVIHIVSDDDTMKDILENIGNLTAIGRGEDFVEVLECSETELSTIDKRTHFKNTFFDVYMPVKYVEMNNHKNMALRSIPEGRSVGGTRYYLPKDYTVEQLKGGVRKRNFNRVPVIFGRLKYINMECREIFLDKTENCIYPVLLA